MFQVTSVAPASPSARLERPSRAELVARAGDLLPDLHPESPRLQTAVLYLASRWIPNVDRLAGFTRLEREFVAKRARRWADHGLWNRWPVEGGDPDAAWLIHAVDVGEGLAPAVVFGYPTEDDALDEADDDEAEDESGSTPAAEAEPEAGSRDTDLLLHSLWQSLGLGAADAASGRLVAA